MARTLLGSGAYTGEERVVASASQAMPAEPEGQLSDRGLSTLHAIGQSLAIGPMLGVGILLAGVSNPQGAAGFNATLSVLAASLGVLGLGYAISLFARRYAGAGAVYEYLSRGAHPNLGVLAAGIYFLGQVWIGGAAVYVALGVLGEVGEPVDRDVDRSYLGT